MPGLKTLKGKTYAGSYDRDTGVLYILTARQKMRTPNKQPDTTLLGRFMTIRLNTAMRNAIADSITSLMGYTTLKITPGHSPPPVIRRPRAPCWSKSRCRVSMPPPWPAATLYTGSPVQGTALASGTAGWARLTDGMKNFDGSVGTSATDFIINTTAITIGGTVTLTGCTINQPAS